MQNSPVLIHVPHASTFIPPNEKRFFLKDDLTDELLKMTDLYTDELFDCGRDMLVFPVSRLVCDVERFRDDTDDPCPNRGHGTCLHQMRRRSASAQHFASEARSHCENVLR